MSRATLAPSAYTEYRSHFALVFPTLRRLASVSAMVPMMPLICRSGASFLKSSIRNFVDNASDCLTLIAMMLRMMVMRKDRTIMTSSGAVVVPSFELMKSVMRMPVMVIIPMDLLSISLYRVTSLSRLFPAMSSNASSKPFIYVLGVT